MNDNSYIVIAIIFIFGILIVYYVFRFAGKKTIKIPETLLDAVESVLNRKVGFYNKLEKGDQEVFRQRVEYFLRTTKISAEKGTEITDEDRVLVAASATIPLFHFTHWAYENLDEVLVYPDYFTEKFSTTEKDRNVAGMVGSGVLNHKMILSLGALRAGFDKRPDGNTAIHEFVHLIDKADGAVDGIPEYLIHKELMEPWIKEMDQTIQEIRTDKSDIRDYAATNRAEFLAVVSEYFFKKPKLLQQDHPELYELLNEIYGGGK
ncbi:zinc-dependent peptidase [Sphingobacterium alkalisoli]|uniref:Zinc-dependent peptidase n=1 Tax=Sphingobacterium alkalisoli TaxID=1874115 RepID=A0A4U0H2Y2_9SPHI|nr:M90 family metallopeptidase [Sphingobacterium alkalisoli]TJY64562.1 zinc-dependent peptidase [Sphingobacterium alkalisoli]GGH20966.1 hypothetical protein GCM10011418_26540 [Sphingobacterium alkalisoli]